MFSLSLVALLAANGFASPVPDTGHISEPRQAPPPGYPQTNVTFGDGNESERGPRVEHT